MLDYAYTRDATGNITEHTNLTEIGFCDEQFCGSAVTLDINRYQYDTVHRLTQSDMNSDIDAFSYDALGNRLSRTHNGASRQYFYGLEDHRLRQIANGTVHSFTHDALGNTLSTHSHTFSYGDNHRLQEVQDSNQTPLATYTYNAQGLRTKKVAATSTYYHYNQEGQLISESDNSGNITKEYMYLNGIPIAMSDANGLHYLHSDHLGTPKVMTDSQQDIVWQATHTAFGEARTDEDPDGDGINVSLNIRFPGQYYDQESGLHYNWHRYYDPSTGRYITSDPIGLAGGINTYLYANANPNMYFDLFGLNPLSSPGGNWGLGNPNGSGTSYIGDSIGGAGDFIDSYADMMNATYGVGGSHYGWSGQDAYFHCRANCEAAQRGEGGSDVAECISDLRETYDQGWPKYDTPQQSADDQVANRYGRWLGGNNPERDCRVLCGKYRPGGSFPPQF